MSLAKKATKGLMALLIALFFALGLAFVVSGEGHTASAATETPVSSLGDIPSTLGTVGEGGTVKLEAGDYTGDLTLTVSQNVTLDLNGQTITGKITVQGDGILTIQNGTVQGAGNAYVIENHGKLVLSGLTVLHTATDATASLVANKTGATLTIKSGTYTTDFIAVKNESTSNLTIEDGTFTANDTGSHLGQAVQNWGAATIQGGTFTGYVGMLNTLDEFEAAAQNEGATPLTSIGGKKLAVSGGEFSEIVGWIAEGDKAYLNLGFTSNISVSAAKLGKPLTKNYIAEGSVLSYATDKYEVKTGTAKISYTEPVSLGVVSYPATEEQKEDNPEIDNYEWGQFVSASYEFDTYDAVKPMLTAYFASADHASANVNLIDDYTGDINIDFADKTVTIGAKVKNKTFNGQIKVANGAKGTINADFVEYKFTNTTAGKAVVYVEKNGTMTISPRATIEREGNYYAIENYGTFTFGGPYNGGKYVSVKHTTTATSSLIANKTGGTMTIDGGTYTTDFIMVKNETDATLTIKSGTFDGSGAKTGGEPDESEQATVLTNEGSATISGGTFKGGIKNGVGTCILWNRTGGTLSITGGTFDGEASADGNYETYLLYNDGTATINDDAQFGTLGNKKGIIVSATGKLEVKGGTFNYCPQPKQGETQTTIISGGKFKSAVYFAEDDNHCAVYDEESQYWTIKSLPSGFWINEYAGQLYKFASISDAVNHYAYSGVVFTLQGDTTGEFVIDFAKMQDDDPTLTLVIDYKLTGYQKPATITVTGTGTLNLLGHGTIMNGNGSTAALKIEEGATVVIGSASSGIALVDLAEDKLTFTHGDNVTGPAIVNAGTLTIYDAQVMPVVSGNGRWEDQAMIVNEATGTLTIENIDLGAPFEAGATTTQRAIQNRGTATLNGGRYNGEIVQRVDGASESSSLTITGGTFAGEVYAATKEQYGSSDENIEKITDPELAAQSGLKFEAEEGKEIAFNSSEIVPENEYFAEGSAPTIDENGEVTVNSTEDAVAIIILQDESTQYFMSLQAAINFAVEYAASDYGALTITLTKNIDSEDVTVNDQVSIILDLAGYTWNGTNSGIVLTVDNERANLTIKSSAAGGKITGDSTHYVIQVKKGTVTLGEKGGDDTYLTVENTGDGPASTIDNFGTLTIESGTYNHHDKPEEGVTKSCNAVKNEGGDATLTINGGVFDGVVLAYGTAEINGGTFKQTVSGGNNLPNPEGVNTNGKLTIKGGTFETMVQSFVEVDISGEPEFKKQVHLYNTGTIEGGKFGTEDANGVSLVVGKNDDTAETGAVTVKGGSFSHQIQTSSALTVEGGTFAEDVVAMRNDGNQGTVTVTGGTFEGEKTVRAYTGTDDPYVAGAVKIEPADDGEGVKFTNSHATLPDLKYFPDPKDIPVSTGSGYTSGGTMAAVAYIGGVGYASLNDAVAAVTDQQTIVLVDDLVGDFTISRSFVFTLDLNGHTITGTDDSANATLTIEGNTNLTIVGDKEGSKIIGTNNYYVIDNQSTLTLKGTNLVVENPEEGKTDKTTSLIRNNKVLTIESGTYTSRTSKVADSVVDGHFTVIKNEDENTAFTIKGGTFNGAVLARGNSTIENGTFNGSVACGNDEDNALGSKNTLTIKDGTFNGTVSTHGNLEIQNGTFKTMVFASAGTMTIQDGTFDFTTSAPDNNCVFAEGTSEIIINGGTYSCQVQATSKVTVNDGTFNGIVSSNPGGSIEINDGTFNKNVQCWGAGTINGGEFNSAVFAAKDDSSEPDKLTITGGEFNAKVGCYNFGESGGWTDIEGALTIDPDTENGKSVTFKEGVTLPDAQYFADPADYPVAKEGGGYVSGDAAHPVVAYIGNVGYETLQAALDAAKTNDTIVLATDTEEDITITGNRTLTLVINAKLTNKTGHTITVSGGTLNLKGTGQVDNVSHGKAALYVGAGATVVVGDPIAKASLAEDKLSFTRSQEAGNGGQANGNSYYTIENHGTLTINDAEVMSTEDGAEHLFSSLIANKTTADATPTLTINGGSFGKAQLTIKTEKGTKTIINGGDFAGQVKDMGETTITGGNFHDIVFAADEGDSGTGNLTISGGSFDENAQVQALGANVTVSGGTFAGGVVSIKDKSKDSSAPHLTITGGEFSSKVAGYEYDPSADGSKFTETVLGNEAIVINPDTENGKTVTFTNAENLPNAAYFADEKDIPVYDGNNYVSGGQSPVAIVGSVGYTSLQEAINAANGKTVTLLAAYNGNLTVSGGNNVTLDLNGYTITGSGDASTILVEQNASLTILSDKEDSAITGKGGHYVIENHGNLTLGAADGHAEFTINSEANEGKSSSTIANKETDGVVPGITIYGGTYQNNNAPKLAAIKNEPNTTIIIYNGTFEGQLQLFGTATINDGTFNDIVFSDYQVVDGVPTAGDVTVRGGQFTSFYAFGKATITNGTFSGNVYALTTDTDGNSISGQMLTITGGTFEGNVDVVDYATKTAQDVSGALTLSGGTISKTAYDKLTSKDLDLEKVVVLDDGKYVIRDKAGATGILFGRSATEFKADTLYQTPAKDNDSRVCYRTDNGAGDWLVVTFTEFKEVATANIQAFYNTLTAGQQYSTTGKDALDAILEQALLDIGKINYVDGVQGVQAINTHLETAKANMNAVLNQEQEQQLNDAIDAEVGKFATYASALNTNFKEGHDIYDAQVTAIKGAKSQAELAVLVAAAQNAMTAFNNSVEAAVREFQLYAASQGIDSDDENPAHATLITKNNELIRTAENYSDIDSKLKEAKNAVNTQVATDYQGYVTERKGEAKDELIEFAKGLGFDTTSEDKYIAALTAGLDEIDKVDPEAGGTLEQVNAALATAKENITKFYNAVENAVVLVTNYAVSNGIDVSDISAQIAAIRAAKVEGTDKDTPDSILKAIDEAKTAVDELVKKNVGDALNARKKTAKDELSKLATEEKYASDATISKAKTDGASAIDKATDIAGVNAALDAAKATIALQVAKIDAVAALDEFKTGRFTVDPDVYTSRVQDIEGATSVEQVNEYRGLALAELTDFHNALLAAEARVRSYATGKGLDLTKDTRGDQIKAELWKATKSDDIETHVTTAKALVDGWFDTELAAQKENAVTNFKTWAAGIDTHFTAEHLCVAAQITSINGATDLTDLASRLSNAQNAVQNLYNAIKRAESELELYALRSGIDLSGEHGDHIDEAIEGFYAAEDEAALATLLQGAKDHIDSDFEKDLEDAKSATQVEEYLNGYVNEMYDPDGATYLADGTVAGYITAAKESIPDDESITSFELLDAAYKAVTDKIDLSIAIMKADAELEQLATRYGITKTKDDSLYDTYKKAVDAATTLEAVEVARAAALVAIENFHDAIERNVEDFNAYATSQGFDLEEDETSGDKCKTTHEAALHAAKDYHALDAALRAAKAAIDTHVASADLAKAIENRKDTAKAELLTFTTSLGLAAYAEGNDQYGQSVDPYKEGITNIENATGTLEAVNKALATAQANVTALHNAIENAVREYGYYATSKGIDYLHSFPDHTGCQEKFTKQIRDSKNLEAVQTNLKAATDDVDKHVELDAEEAVATRKESAIEEIKALGAGRTDTTTNLNDTDKQSIADLWAAAEKEINAIDETSGGTLEDVNGIVTTYTGKLNLLIAKLDAIASLDAYNAEHFTNDPDALADGKGKIETQASIDEVNSAYATALSELTTLYNALVDAEALARSYVMTNGFDLGANVPDKEPEQTWDAFVKETIWSATKTADVEGKVTAVQSQVNTAVAGVLENKIKETQAAFATWADELNKGNFKAGNTTYDNQYEYIGDAESLDELATRLSNAQNAMQNLYNAMKNAAEAVRLYAFLKGIDPDGADYGTQISGLIDTLYTANDEEEITTKLSGIKGTIDGYAELDAGKALEAAKNMAKDYLETYVKNTYGMTDGEKFLTDTELQGIINDAEAGIKGNDDINTVELLEAKMREAIAKIDVRIAQIKAVSDLKVHADGYKFAAGTENIEAYTKGVTAINEAKASVEAVNEALATAMANVTAFYNKIEDAVNQFHVYAVSQGIDLTKAPHDACDTTYSGNIRKAKTDSEVEEQLAAAKKHVDEHVKAALTDAITNRKSSARAELKQHAESLGFTINDETGRENNIEVYNTGISNIDSASTIDDINTALATAKANVTTFYNQVEAAVSEFKLYAIQKGVDFTNPKPGHENCEKNLAAQLRGSKNDTELGQNLKAVKEHVDAHVKDNEEQAVKNRRTSALEEVTKMGEGYDVNKTINGDSITSLRAAATDQINVYTDDKIKENPADALENINRIVEEARGKIELLCAKFDAIGEVDTYAQGLGFKATAKIKAWIDGTTNIEGAKDIQSVTQQRELALLAIAAFKSDLDNAEVTATAYATSHGINLTTNVPGIAPETTWTKWIHDTLWTATNSEGITTKLNEVRSKINSAASDALRAAIDNKVEEFKKWAPSIDTHFTETHKLVVAQIEVLRHAASIDAIPALYDQVQSTVKAVKAAMESAISEIKTYALRNGVDINDEAHKSHIDDAIEGIYSAADEATIRSYVDQIKQHIDDHVASDVAAALVAMKGKAEEMLKDAVPDEYESDDKITKLIAAGVTALNGTDIDSIEKFNAELDNQLALLAVRVAQLDAEKELKAHATSYGMAEDIDAVTKGVEAIEAATTIPDVEMQLRGALLAVTEFNGKITTAVAGVRTYAVLNGVDPDDSRIDYDAIKNAKNEDGITTAVEAAKKVIDGIRDDDLAAALEKRKGTAKEELKAFAEPRTGLEVDAYTQGVAAIEAAGDISGVNTALEEARDDVEEYYNLYLDALLGLRTHAASHGHDLGDAEHKETLEAVTNLLKEAKNAKDLEEKAKEAKTLLDDHIKKHDDENALAAYIESKVNELRFYAIEKGVKLSDDIVKSAIKAMQEVTVKETLADAKVEVDNLFYTAKEAIDKKSEAEDTEAGKKAVVDALKLYAAAKGVEFTADMENKILSEGTVEEAALMAAQVKAQIDEIAALATAKAEALEDLGIYAAAKDVAWDDAWDTQIGSATTKDEVDAAGEKIGAEIDAIAAFNTAKAQALEDLRIYAATVGVAWDSEWADTLNDATDNDTLEVAVAEVRDAIDALADLASVKAETLKELRLYAAMKGVAWNEVWTETINACVFASTIEEAAGKIYAEIDNIATLASYIQSKAEELRLYALEKGISLSDKAVTDAVSAMQNVKLGGTYNTLELAQAAVDEAFNAAKTAIDTAAGNNSLTSYKQATIEDLKLYAAMKGVAFTADMEATITAQTTAEAVAAEAQKIRTQIDSAATLASAKAQAETQLRTYAEMMGVAWKNEWTTAIAGAANTDAVTAQITAIRGEISAAAALASAKAQAIQELRIYAAGVGIMPDDAAVAEEEAKINAAETVAAVGTALASAKETIKRHAATEGTSTKYLVVFVANGNVVSVQNVTKGGSATKPADPEVYGKVFKGWVGTFTNVTSDLVITAEFDEAPNITEAKDDITDWLNEYLDNILNGVSDENATAAVRTAAVSGDALTEKLNKVYSEANAKLVKGYYDEAIYYIENAESDNDVEYAVISFRNNVSAVEILEELVKRPVAEESSSAVEVAALVIGIIALVCAAAAVTAFLVFRKKKETAGAEGVEETPDSTESDK